MIASLLTGRFAVVAGGVCGAVEAGGRCPGVGVACAAGRCAETDKPVSANKRPANRKLYFLIYLAIKAPEKSRGLPLAKLDFQHLARLRLGD